MGVKNIIGELRINGRKALVEQPSIVATFDITQANTKIMLTGLPNSFIDWGDGNSDNCADSIYANYSHFYEQIGIYTCKVYGVTSIIGDVDAMDIGSMFVNKSTRNSLTKVIINDTVTSIGDGGALYDCDGLTSVTIPNSVTSIGQRAFQDCTNLTSVVIPDSVGSIGYCAFLHCSSLTEIVIPESVTSIDYGAFSNCDSLTSVTFKNPISISYKTSQINGWFYGCQLLSHIYVPYGCAEAYKTKWAADGAEQAILDLIVENDREAMMSDLETSMASLEKLVDGLTDAQITALNNFAKSLVVTEE